MAKKIIIVGGHGNIALRLARILGSDHEVTSIIRDSSQSSDITGALAQPLVLSLEDSPVSEFGAAFEGKDLVYFLAGAGGKGGDERTKKVDYEGAVKVFDSIEAVQGPKPRLVHLSAIDVRDPEKIPEHYNEADLEGSKKTWGAIGTYMHWKYEADKNLVNRNAFKWTILRPGGLTNDLGVGKGEIGVTHLGKISRNDVAVTLALLADREDAAGLAFDLVNGNTPLKEALDGAVKNGKTAWIG